MKSVTRLALGAALLLQAGCTSLESLFMAQAVADGLHAIESYEATTTEHGLLRRAPGTPVVKRVVYEKLWKVRAEVLEPAEHRGQVFCYDGATLSIWWPKWFFGIRIRGATPPPRNEVGDAIVADCHWLLERYDFDDQPRTIHAGRTVTPWTATPSGDDPHCRPYRAWLDTQYQIPLRLEVEDGGRPWYRVAYDPIAFDVEVPTDAFAFEFPAGAAIHEWDLSDPGVSLAAAQAQLDVPLLLPRRLPPGHTVRTVVLSEGSHGTMAAVLMNHRGHWLSLSEVPNLGPILVPELGVPVQVGDAKGILNFVFGYTIVSWAQGNTALTLIGNLPYPELLAIAASVGPAEEAP